MSWHTIPVLLTSYFLGAIPFGYLLGRLKSLDITSLGSGNIGATNTFRILGPAAGMAVLLLDAGKGFLAAYLGQHIGGSEMLAVMAGSVAVLAHSYSVFLNWRGGRGVACAAGVLLYLMPYVVLIELAVFIATVALTRYVSLGSVTVALLLPLIIYFKAPKVHFLVFGVLAGAFVTYKHIPNIKRLLAGTEAKFGKRV
ncbi:MAG: glycerol-3-phosphate 1-O-acyltransferase PlsY [bacterium]|jgi:glycerol-3-phosphate acyltransferase PlsY